MHFDFATANRVLFGEGTIDELKRIVEDGRRIFLVQGPASTNAQRVRSILEEKRCEVRNFFVISEPAIDVVNFGIEMVRASPTDWVIAVGGGSVIDTGKAVASLAVNPGRIDDYLEVIGKGSTIKSPSLPMIAVPTTAGTGSEVTRNAVISVPEEKLKVSLRSPYLLPRVAIIDPELTLSLPPEVTASTGMDALAQVLEPFVSRRSNPMTDLFCRQGLALAARSLAEAYRNGKDRKAREGMCFVSLLGGFALANAGLGAVHGFASPIGAMFTAPHGAVCARLLPAVVRANVDALRKREPGSETLIRYAEVAYLLTGDETAPVEKGVEWLEHLLVELHIPALTTYGISENDIPLIVSNAAIASSMKANPIQLTEDELAEILTEAL